MLRAQWCQHHHCGPVAQALSTCHFPSVKERVGLGSPKPSTATGGRVVLPRWWRAALPAVSVVHERELRNLGYVFGFPDHLEGAQEGVR